MMELQEALERLHSSLPREASYSVRFSCTVDSVEDFTHHRPDRTGRHGTREVWSVTVLLRRDTRTYLEAVENVDLERAVHDAENSVRSWLTTSEAKPPKLVAHSHAGAAIRVREVS